MIIIKFNSVTISVFLLYQKIVFVVEILILSKNLKVH